VRDDEEFREFVASSSSGLLRLGWLLTGDYQLAEDLLQTALIRAWPHWRRVTADGGGSAAYVRRIMVTTYATWWRRRWRGEVPHGQLPDRAVAGDAYAETELREVVLRALAELPPKQRAVVALRYYADLPEEEIARILDCSPGTVKSQASKALAKLRTRLPAWTGEEMTR
jgi:RNA polymerase sigma-70 factor (sigma-E family)